MIEVSSLSEITDNVNSGNTDTNTNNQNTQNNSGCVYDKYGRTPDKSQICAIGIKSASADTQSGIVKCVFKNECPHCHNASLMWGWKWDNDPEKVQKFDGTDGTAEGHIYCVQSEGGCDADYSIEGNEHIDGSQYKLTLISGPTQSTEEEAQQLSNGQLACDGSSVGGTTSVGGGSAVSIPDKTFYGIIKQIIGATDSLFIIANNMAYLLSFKDFYEYRNQFNDYIPKIERKDVLNNSINKNWSTDGYYNTVEVTYADGIVKYQNDDLVKQYGESTFYYEFLNDDEETAKAKADALLASHIRDYSTDVQLSIFYNENITEGSWVQVHKSITEISGKTNKEIQQDELKKQGKTVSSKRKGITIENLVEKTLTENNVTKTIQNVTDSEGNTFNIEVENGEYELFFVQSFTCRWDKDNSLIMDLELKYGPDTPEDPVNATVGVGGSASSGASTSAVGGQAADINAFVQQCIGSSATQDKATAEKLYKCLQGLIVYSYYECSHYTTASECYQHAKELNCADTSRLVTACYKAAGFQCQVVWGPGHFWNELQVGSETITVDLSSGTTGVAPSKAMGDKLNAGGSAQRKEGDNPHC